ncbi:hypothetical protein SERLA73DRAFT_149579 [Serpula lacrymans var. lacrymans S7.3]|uniref:Uncharacterized protein n=1 Tax=Serpula lacrymans var. lacrymans (strain S7.3) TaxID=936435 RepID=F8PJ14_SERL3|nr:hypothetical protein SERLA73DRAFT_149579 [Serpula lacrymans var. lacrymans S7.3]
MILPRVSGHLIINTVLIKSNFQMYDRTAIGGMTKKNLLHMIKISHTATSERPLALVAYSIECALLGAINNATIEFSETAFSARWNHHMRLLENFQKCSPTYLVAVVDEIDKYVWNGCIIVGQSDVSKLIFDFDALEKAAKTSK